MFGAIRTILVFAALATAAAAKPLSLTGDQMDVLTVAAPSAISAVVPVKPASVPQGTDVAKSIGTNASPTKSATLAATPVPSSASAGPQGAGGAPSGALPVAVIKAATISPPTDVAPRAGGLPLATPAAGTIVVPAAEPVASGAKTDALAVATSRGVPPVPLAGSSFPVLPATGVPLRVGVTTPATLPSVAVAMPTARPPPLTVDQMNLLTAAAPTATLSPLLTSPPTLVPTYPSDTFVDVLRSPPLTGVIDATTLRPLVVRPGP